MLGGIGEGGLKARDKILLHLLTMRESGIDGVKAPFSITQAGIAEAIFVSQNSVSVAIRKLIDEELIRQQRAHVDGYKRQRQTYALAPQGRQIATEIFKQLRERFITLRDRQGFLREIRIANVPDYLSPEAARVSPLEILHIVHSEGVFDCADYESRVSTDDQDELDRIHFFSVNVPSAKHFVGRRQELYAIRRWFESEECKVVVIYGIPGIGKTSLGFQIQQQFKQQKNTFWYRFREWDTTHSLVTAFGEYLKRLGRPRLASFVQENQHIDIAEVSIILEDELKDTESFLFFDDFHLVDENLVKFFGSLLDKLEIMDNIQLVMMGRFLLHFYDRRDVVIKNAIAELQLEGLDEDSAAELLGAKGFNPSDIKRIYDVTSGHPLLMELVNSADRLIEGPDIWKYLYEEVHSLLTDPQRRVLQILSIYRYPVPQEAFLLESQNVTYEDLEALVQRSLIQELEDGRYDIHLIFREFFSKRITPKLKRRYHFEAGQHYEPTSTSSLIGETVNYRGHSGAEETLLEDCIEAIYHYLQAGAHKRAAVLAAEYGPDFINGGYLEEFHNLLEDSNLWLDKSVQQKYEAPLLILKGDILSHWGEWDSATDYYQDVLSISDRQKDIQLKARTYRKLGKVHILKSEFEKALDQFEKALGLSVQEGDLLGQASAQQEFGYVCCRQGKFAKAITHLEDGIEAVHAWRRSAHKESTLDKEATRILATIYTHLGLVHLDQGEWDAAIQHYDESERLLLDIDARFEFVRLYNNLGVAYQRKNDLNRSIEYYQKSMDNSKHTGNVLVVWTLFNMGEVFALMGEYQKALECCQDSLNISERHHYREGISGAYQTYGVIYKLQGDWKKSIQYFKENLKIRKELNMPYRLADGYHEFGLMYKEKGDHEHAREMLQQSHKIFSKIGNKQYVDRIQNEIDGLEA